MTELFSEVRADPRGRWTRRAMVLVGIRALTAIEHPRLVLGDGWIEGMQVNSIERAAESETSRDGHVVLSYGGLVGKAKAALRNITTAAKRVSRAARKIV